MDYEDTIQSLPVEETPPEETQLTLANAIFSDKKATKALFAEFTDVIIMSVLFILFSSESVDNLIRKYIVIAGRSRIYLTGIKCFLFVFLFYIIKNVQLIRK
jgi:hypothetical protein